MINFDKKTYHRFLQEIKNPNFKNNLNKFVKIFNTKAKQHNLLNYVHNLTKTLIILFTISNHTEEKLRFQKLITELKNQKISPIKFFEYQAHLLFTLPFLSAKDQITQQKILDQYNKTQQLKEELLHNLNIYTISNENIIYFEETIKDKLKSLFSFLGKKLLSFGMFFSFLFNIFNNMIDFLTLPILKLLPGGPKVASLLSKGITSVIPFFFSMNLSPTMLTILSIYNFSRGPGRFIGNIGETVNSIKSVMAQLEEEVDKLDWDDLEFSE